MGGATGARNTGGEDCRLISRKTSGNPARLNPPRAPRHPVARRGTRLALAAV